MTLDKSPKTWISIDLEMNNDIDENITDIIQIGAVAFNIESGEVIERFNKFVKLPSYNKEIKKIHPKIVKMTGITDKILDEQGTSLYLAYSELVQFMKRNDCFRDAVCWGGNDTAYLLKELKSKCSFRESFIFGRNYFDAKKMFQVFAGVNGISIRSGLAKSMSRFGLVFKGKIHNALSDAENTMSIFLFIRKNMLIKNTRKDIINDIEASAESCWEAHKKEFLTKESDKAVYTYGFEDGYNTASLKMQRQKRQKLQKNKK